MHTPHDILALVEPKEKETSMRTTLNLSEKLLAEGLKVTHLKTKTELITTAVRELILKHKLASLKKFKGKIDLKIDLDTLRERS